MNQGEGKTSPLFVNIEASMLTKRKEAYHASIYQKTEY